VAQLNVVKPAGMSAHATSTEPSTAVDAPTAGAEKSSHDDSSALGTAPSDAVMLTATAAPAPPTKRVRDIMRFPRWLLMPYGSSLT